MVIRLLISSDEWNSQELQTLSDLLEESDFRCEASEQRGGESHLPILVTIVPEGSFDMAIQVIQSWVRGPGGRQVKVEVQQPPIAGEPGSARSIFDDRVTVLAALQAILSAGTSEAFLEAVKAHPILLQGDLDRIFSDIVAAQSDPKARAFLEERLSLVKEIRDGLPPLADEDSVNGGNHANVSEEFDRFSQAYGETGLPAYLERALGLAESLVDKNGSPILPQANGVSIVAQAASLGYQTYKKTNDSVLLDRVARLCTMALDRFAGDHSLLNPLWNVFGLALKARYQLGHRAEDINQAIVLFERSSHSLPSSEAISISVNIADALRARFEETNALGDIDRAISIYEHAERSAHFPDRLRVGLSRNIAKSRAARFRATEDPTDLDRAISTFVNLIAHSPDQEPVVCDILAELSQAYLDRFEHYGSNEDLQRAIAEAERADVLAKVLGPARFHVLITLGNAHQASYELHGRVDALNAAARSQNQALTVALRDDEKATACVNLAIALSYRYRRSGDLSDLNEAIQLTRQGLNHAGSGSTTEALVCNTLGNLLVLFHFQTNAPDLLDEAVTLLRRAVSASTGNVRSAPLYLHSLGVALAHRLRERRDAGDFKESKDCIMRAEQLLPASSPERVNVANSLAAVLVDSSLLGERAKLEDVDAALEMLRRSLARTPDDSPVRFQVETSLAVILSIRYGLTHNQADLDNAMHAYRAASWNSSTSTVISLQMAKSWGKLASDSKSWADAANAYQIALVAADELVSVQRTQSGKESWLADIQGLGIGAAVALVHLGKPHEAVVALEQSSSILLSQSLRLTDVDLTRLSDEGQSPLANRFRAAADTLARLAHEENSPTITSRERKFPSRSPFEARNEYDRAIEAIRQVVGYESFLRAMQFSEIAAVAAERPLVYLCADKTTGLALIVNARSSRTANAMWLPGLTSEKIIEQVSLLLAFHLLDQSSEPDPSAQALWRRSLSAATRWLWDAAIAPTIEGLGEEPSAILISHGLLGLLPLHAAWKDDEKAVTLRTYALDAKALSYAPNARSLIKKRMLLDANNEDRILLVADPSPIEGNPLPFARVEATAAEDFFGSSSILQGEDATRSSVIAAVRGPSVVHFACHGFSNPQNPLLSGLLMAHDQVITAGEFLQLRLDTARLVVLSACQTAVTGISLPEEAIGLPSALLQSGVTAVVSTLWSVGDPETMLLVDRFYYLWKRKGVVPAAALRLAQQWVRDTTNAEKMRDLAVHHPTKVVSQELAEELHLLGHDNRSFTEPEHWAAFVFIGL